MNPVLVTKENLNQLIQEVASSPLVGLDCETDHVNPNPKLMEYAKSQKQVIMDVNHLWLCGVSFSPSESNSSYYINIGHSDVQNQLTKEEVLKVLNSLNKNSYWVIHNFPFEYMVFKKVLNYELKNAVCTLQMAVSLFGKDEYDKKDFFPALKNWAKYVHQWINKNSSLTDEEKLYYITAKSSYSKHSYNGLINNISYNYGLKYLVSKFLGKKMTTYEEVIGSHQGMKNLTSTEVLSYACDDSYYALQLFNKFLQIMLDTNPSLVDTFFNQENPMTKVYGEIWANGLKIDSQQVKFYKNKEYNEFESVTEELRNELLEIVPFPKSAPYLESEIWYKNNYIPIIEKLTDWCTLNKKIISSSVFESSSIKNGINLSFYMVIRSILYGILGLEPIFHEGKMQSDGDTRGKLKEKNITNIKAVKVIDLLNKIVGIEQRVKLYLTPYESLIDPFTCRVYPVVSSRLVTRRMASSFPNPMQLGKRGESSYIRGFYIPNKEDHLLVSIDWSSIELVEIAEFSKDPVFVSAYSSLPHKDLHSAAASSILGINEENFKKLKDMTKEEALDMFGEKILINTKGEFMDPPKAYNYWRTEIGKGANFNYWYSGSLNTVAERMGWTSERMWEAVDQYRSKFFIAEHWRVSTIEKACCNGYIRLPDNHLRRKFELTSEWQTAVNFVSGLYYSKTRDLFSKVFYRVHRRARNQIINSLIQGTCATIAKRSILRILSELDRSKFDFLIPIHDELLFSVQIDYIPEFIEKASSIMCDHPDIFKLTKLDTGIAVGKTFEPWHEQKAPYGLMELNEHKDLTKIISYLYSSHGKK